MKKIAIIAAAIAATVGTPALAQDDHSGHAEKIISQINNQIENTSSIDSATSTELTVGFTKVMPKLYAILGGFVHRRRSCIPLRAAAAFFQHAAAVYSRSA